MNASASIAIKAGLFALLGCAIIASSHDTHTLLLVALLALWGMYASAWNLFSGFGGLVSFGHAIYFGCGGFATILITTTFGVTPAVGLVAAMILAAAMAVLVALVTFRLRGYFFGLATLAIPVTALYFAEWAGLQEIFLPLERERPMLYLQFANPKIMPLICWFAFSATVAISMLAQDSRFGMGLAALRQNEEAAEASGVSAFRFRFGALILSAVLTGLAGGLYAVVVLVMTPASGFGLHVSAQPLIFSIFGGLGTVWGPVIGAAMLFPATELLRGYFGSSAPGLDGILLGSMALIVMLFMPDGIVRSQMAQSIRQVASRFAFFRAGPLAGAQSAPSSEFKGHAAETRSAPPALEAQNITVIFGGVRALQDVSVAIRPGEILGIVGPNGAGKSTLLNVLDGFVKPQSGQVTFGGRRLNGLRPNAIARLGIGRTFQTARPFPEMTMIENVMVGGVVLGGNPAALAARASTVLAALGQHDIGERQGTILTNYELRIVELARAMAASPKVLLLDEPFAGLAVAEIDRLIEALRWARSQSVSIAIVDHTIPSLRRFVDRMVVLDTGTLIADGAPDDVLIDQNVVRAYLGSDEAA